MPPTITEQLAQIEQLLHDKRYIQAIQSISLIDKSSLSKEEYGYYCILYAEASLQVGDYSIEKFINKAIEIFRPSDTEKFARAKYLKGWYLSSLNKHAEAIEVLTESYSNYLRCENLSMAARVLNRLSYNTFKTGEIGQAIASLKKSIGIFNSLGDHVTEAKVAHNLAAVYWNTGQFDEAIRSYKSYPLSLSVHGKKDVLLYYELSSIPYALKGNITRAKRIIKKAEPLLGEFVRERVIYLENLGLIHLLAGDYRKADDALSEGLYLARQIAPVSALTAQILRLRGDVSVATGDFNEAKKYAKEALSVAEKINEQVEIAACWRIFAEVSLHEGLVEKASKWFRKAIDLFQRIDSRYELAVTRYRFALSCLHGKKERSVLLTLAYDYFKSEDVAPYVKKVEDALHKLSQPATGVPRSEQKGAPAIITADKTMKEILHLAQQVAPLDMAVLLTGETGTGKDLLAKYIHYHSGRRGKFVSVNASAIPAEMIEAELFGHTASAFTGAKQERKGLFEEADNGTFYLNEIADASPAMQAKLLEVLESHQIRRLGENKTREVNFRLIAATNHDLQQRMKEGLFRADLYHRLCEAPFHLPPLRKRVGDIPLLVKHFLAEGGAEPIVKRGADFDQLCQLLSARYWQGNVRELQAEVKRLWAYCNSDIKRMAETVKQNAPELEREGLLVLLIQNGWNKAKVARILGVSEALIRYRIKKYGLKEK